MGRVINGDGGLFFAVDQAFEALKGSMQKDAAPSCRGISFTNGGGV
ncbi:MULTISPECIES: hypothetical protein [unclassified Iodidimonas]|jgi:hypothetical protein|nr:MULTISPECIES: hypothetical protein [unclassified Iodidimonas]